MCKFNHPKDIEIPSSQNEPESAVTVEGETDIGSAADSVSAMMQTPVAAAQEFNSKGLPMRPVCPYQVPDNFVSFVNHFEKTCELCNAR